MNNIIKRVWNQNRMVNIEDLSGMAFQAESGGHTFEISGVDDAGNAVPLSGTVAGVFRRADNADIALTGSASGGIISVTLTADCYAVPGRFGLTIFVTSNSQKVAIYAAVGTIAQTSGGAVAGDTPQDVVDLINAIEAAIAEIPASYTDIMAAIAPTYSSSALYTIGDYAWYNGALKRCIVPITTAETFTAAHWVDAVIGSDFCQISEDGKNIADEKRLLQNSNWSFDSTDGFYKGTLRPAAGYTTKPFIDTAYEANTQYRVSVIAKVASNYGTGNGMNCYAKYTGDNTNYLLFRLQRNDTTAAYYSAVTDAGKTVSSLFFSYSSGAGDDTVCIKDLMVAKAYEKLPFEEHGKTAVDKTVRAGVLFPSGDTTDRALEISAILSDHGCCELMPGDYYVSGIAMPDDSMIIGHGLQSRIILLAGGTNAVTLHSRNTVKNLAILGDTSDITLPISAGTRSGILYEGTGETSIYVGSIIDGCYFKNFDLAAMTFNNTGYGTDSGCMVSNCLIDNCYYGINIPLLGEFNKFSNVRVTHCHIGCLDNGGNNVFTGCGFDANDQQLLMDNTDGTRTNNSHGGFIGCTFNHSLNNAGTAIEIIGMTTGEIFSGCQIFYGGIVITNGYGFVFDSCNFGKNTPISITCDGLVMFANCMFRSASNSPITVSSSHPERIKFVNCFTKELANAITP